MIFLFMFFFLFLLMLYGRRRVVLVSRSLRFGLVMIGWGRLLSRFCRRMCRASRLMSLLLSILLFRFCRLGLLLMSRFRVRYECVVVLYVVLS